MTAIVDKDPGPTDPPGPAAPTKKPARPKRYVVILVLVMLFGGLSPFVALGVLGGVALERLSSQKERSRRERGFDGFLVAVMLVALVAFPIGHAMVDRHNERELQEAVDQLRSRQENWHLPRPDTSILIRSGTRSRKLPDPGELYVERPHRWYRVAVD